MLYRLILLITVCGFTDLGRAAPKAVEDLANCENGLIQPLKRGQQSFRALIEDQVLLLRSRLGHPTYSEPRFDVRIIAKAGLPDFSPNELQASTIAMVSRILNKYEALGFTQKSFIQIVVEAKSNSINKRSIDEYGVRIFTPDDNSTPWVGDVNQTIYLPGLVGYERFTGTFAKGKFQDQPMFMVFPMRDSQNHWLGDPFIVAHEIAHLTENSKSFKSRIWKEARADSLAYLATDLFQLKFVNDLAVQIFDPKSGESRAEQLKIARDLSNPRIFGRAQYIPHIEAAHQNSEIFSSLVFKIRIAFGAKLAGDLIKWMDAQTHDQDDRATSAEEILTELDRIAENIRVWTRSKIPSQAARTINGWLNEKGF